VIDEIEPQLAKAGLLDKYRPQLDYIKSHASINLIEVPYDKIPSLYEIAMTLLSYLTLIQMAIVEKNREDLFRDYLPK
jgi:hypothetical protein